MLRTTVIGKALECEGAKQTAVKELKKKKDPSRVWRWACLNDNVLDDFDFSFWGLSVLFTFYFWSCIIFVIWKGNVRSFLNTWMRRRWGCTMGLQHGVANSLAPPVREEVSKMERAASGTGWPHWEGQNFPPGAASCLGMKGQGPGSSLASSWDHRLLTWMVGGETCWSPFSSVLLRQEFFCPLMEDGSSRCRIGVNCRGSKIR